MPFSVIKENKLLTQLFYNTSFECGRNGHSVNLFYLCEQDFNHVKSGFFKPKTDLIYLFLG